MLSFSEKIIRDFTLDKDYCTFTLDGAKVVFDAPVIEELVIKGAVILAEDGEELFDMPDIEIFGEADIKEAIENAKGDSLRLMAVTEGDGLFRVEFKDDMDEYVLILKAKGVTSTPEN